jgi:hypothetical protein
VQRYAIEQRLLQMQNEDERLAELNVKLSAISSSPCTNSSPANPTPSESEM